MAWPPIPQTLVSSPFPVNFGYTYLQVSNTQSAATPANFQQYIQLPSQLSLNTWPLRFYADPALTQPLYAWYETPTTVWVLLPNGVPANSSVNVYFNVGASDGVYTGMAPYLSSTYGALDNGANVFNFYDNFAGTSLNTNKWLPYSDGFSATINNGFTISLSAGQISSGNNAAYVITSQTEFSPSIIAEAYAQGSSAVTRTRSYMPGLTTTTSTTEGVNIVDQTSYHNMAFSNGRNNVVTYADFQGSSSAQYYNNVASPSNYNIIGLAYTGSTNTWYMNYGAVVSSSTDSPSGNVYFALGMGVYNGNPDAASMSVYWVRIRAYPPNGVMPTVSLL